MPHTLFTPGVLLKTIPPEIDKSNRSDETRYFFVIIIYSPIDQTSNESLYPKYKSNGLKKPLFYLSQSNIHGLTH